MTVPRLILKLLKRVPRNLVRQSTLKFMKLILDLRFYRRHIPGGSNLHNLMLVGIDYYKQLKSQFTNFLKNH
jgi:hypothetical protein